MLVDDLSKVHEILKEVKKIDPSRPTPPAGNWTKFDQVIRSWMTYTNEEKDRVFTELLSYELDLFIMKKDP